MKAQTKKRLLVTLLLTLLSSLTLMSNVEAAKKKPKPTDEQKAEMAAEMIERCTARLNHISDKTLNTLAKIETRTVDKINGLPEEEIGKTNHIVKKALRHVRSATKKGSRSISKECHTCMGRLKRLDADTKEIKALCKSLTKGVKNAAKETSDVLKALRVEDEPEL